MKPEYLLRLLQNICIILCLFITKLSAQTANADSSAAPTEIYVKLKSGFTHFQPNANSAIVNVNQELSTLQSAMQKYKYTQALRPFYFSRSEKLQKVYRIKIEDPVLVEKFINELQQNPAVEYAEKITQRMTQYIETPNDPQLNKMWHLNKIQALEAFSSAQSKTIIPLGLIDAFMQVDHPDLFQNMSFCQDLVFEDMDVRPPIASYNHGTHVSGIIGAATNNGIGVSGVSFNRVKIIGLNSSPNGTSITHYPECLARIVELGSVRVVNMSFGGGYINQTERLAIQLAHEAGIVLVAAAGNNSSPYSFYPASLDGVISVASTDSLDQKSSFSNFGTNIDIAAPGSNIYSTLPYNQYGNLSGTSMASPLVAGTIGFLLSVRPEMNADTVENLIKNTADDISSINPNYKLKLGYGRVNFKRALTCINTHSTNSNFTIVSTGNSTYCNGQTYVLSVPVASNSSTYQWYKNGDPIQGATDSAFSVDSSGLYAVTITKNTCPRKSQWLTINFGNCAN